MKKSMLLSTIAMIVVVVVALSTATFAWFSSFNTVTASAQLNIAAQDAGLEIREYTPGEPATAKWEAWTNAVTLEATGLTATAPKAQLTAPEVNDADSTAAFTNAAEGFFIAQAEKAATGTTGADNVAYVAGDNVWKVTKATATNGTEYIYKDIQVRATTAKAKKIICSVTVAAAEGSNEADVAAATATRVAIASNFKGTKAVVGSDYKHGLKNVTTITDGQIVKAPNAGTSVTLNGTSGTYTDDWTTVADDTTAAQWVSIRVFIWIDGFTADNAAKNGNINVAISFTSEDVTP